MGNVMEDPLAKSRLAVGAGQFWEMGTRAEFLEAVGEDALPAAAFDRWLVEDYLFVKGFARFVALTTAVTPRPAQSLLIGGLVALDDELGWFEAHSDERGLDLSTEPHRVCRRYVDFLIAAAYARPMEVLLAIFFGVEAAYTVAWGRLKPEGRYTEFIERWTSPEFRSYVEELGRLVDANPHPDQQSAFNEVLQHEQAFWRMTWEG